MTEDNLFEEEMNLEDEITDVPPDELTLLKQRADVMGIQYHPSIKLDKLKAKIAEKTAPPEEKVDPSYAKEEYDTIQEAQKTASGKYVEPLATPTPLQQKMARRDKALQLVRIRVACMNPIKGNLKGEIVSVGNADIGMIKKYIPFNAEQGWHVPQIILNVLQNKKFMTHFEIKQGNKRIKRNKLIPEYSIEILPALTAKELEALKQRQLMAQGN